MSGRTRLIGVAMAVAVAVTIPGAAAAASQGPKNVRVWQEQTVPAPDVGLTIPTDISYQPNLRRLLIQGKQGDKKVLRKTTLLGQRKASRPLPGAAIGTTFDPRTNEVVVVEKVPSRASADPAVVKVTASRGQSTPKGGRVVDVNAAKLRDVVIASDGKVYGLLGRKIVLLTRAKGNISGKVRQVMTVKGRIGINADALVIGPGGDRFWVLDREGKRLYRLNAGGSADRVIRLGSAGVKSPKSAVWAPSADPTDPAAEHSLYVADAGQMLRGNRVKAGIKELTRVAPARPKLSLAAAGPGSISLIQTINTFAWTSPSPDPMGLAWAGPLDRYTLVDSEVIENNHPAFGGSNVWNFTPTGSANGKTDTSSWETEPVGLAFDGNVGRYFVVSDSKQRIWQVKPGPDGDYWSGDDIRQSFSTSGFAVDPEGLAFGEGKIFVADGASKQVYVLDPGNGDFFDGFSTLSYDVESLGIQDAEGIAYAGDRNSLFVLSRKGDMMIEVVPTTGQLISTYSLNDLGARNPSGLAYGPRSTDGSQKSLFMSDRGVDNNDDPDENDGKIYEISVSNEPPEVKLKNGSFEQDSDGNGQPDVWSQNSRFTRSTDSPQAGSYVGKHVGANNNHTIKQDVDGIVPGQTYRFSGFINAMTGSDSYNFKARLIWRNASNKKIQALTIQQYRNDPSAGWESFSADKVAPANAAIARIVMVVKDLNGTILVDDWALE